MIGFIYLIQNKHGGIYIGQTKYLKKRWIFHCNRLNNNKHDNINLQKDWNKYGESAFEFKIAEEVTTDLTISEQYWIDAYRAAGIKIYNMIPAGYPPDNNGRIRSPEHRKIISERHRGNTYRRGSRHTEEAKMKMSKAALGKKDSLETRQKKSKSAKIAWSLPRKQRS